MATLIATQTGTLANAATSTITVPTGVTSSHLGVVVCANANTFTTVETFAISGWTSRAANPSAGQNMNWTVLTNLGGTSAGSTLTVNQSGTTAAGAYWAAWFDTAGNDVVVASTPSGRGGTSQATVAITGLTTTANSQDVLILSSERSTATGTVVSSWSPGTPTQDLFQEDATGTAVSTFIGHFTQATAGATGTYTATYNGASGNGVGMMLLAAPSAFSGSASTSGSGSLTTSATVAATKAVGLTGGGTVAVTTSTPGLSGALSPSGTGTLTGSGVGISVTPVALSGGGLLSAHYSGTYTFQGPTILVQGVMERGLPFLLRTYLDYGLSVWKDASGQWHQAYGPSNADLVGADPVYAGGRTYSIGYDEAIELSDGGYGEYVSPMIVTNAAVSVSFVGAGSLAVTSLDLAGSAALTGSGVFTVSVAALTPGASAVVNGTGSLTATGVVTFPNGVLYPADALYPADTLYPS